MTLVAGLWWCTGLAMLIGSTALALVQPGLARRRAISADRPPISAVVPLTAFGPQTASATKSLLDQAYPGLDLTFAAAEPDADALAPAEALARDGDGPVPWRAITTPPAGPGLNPKVANLAPAILDAPQGVILMKDALTVLPAGHVAAMAAMLAPRIGLVVSAPIGRAPSGFVAAIEAAVMNGYGARLLLAAAALRLDVGIGAVMLARQADIIRSDALAAMAATPADDHALAKAMRRIGLATAFTPGPVSQSLGRRAARDVWRRHRRWALCRRQEEPAAFLAEPALGLVAVGLAGAAAAPGLGFTPLSVIAATILAWLAVELTLTLAKGWPLPPSLPFAILVREALMPVLWLAVALAPPRGRGGER